MLAASVSQPPYAPVFQSFRRYSPCGWVFVIGVKRDQRLRGVGTRMLDALCQCFRRRGITRVRTMIARQDHELLAFFRSHGMLAGPYQQLEKSLD